MPRHTPANLSAAVIAACRWRSRATPARSRCPKCQQVYVAPRNIAQGALRYVKLKAEGLWPMCSVEGCDSEAKTARGAHCAAHAERLAQGP